MKYKLIYTFSLLMLLFIWIYPSFIISGTETYIQSDSTSLSSSSPSIVYIERESNTNVLGLSNEIVTLIIGLGNIITMYHQFKKK